MLSQVAATLSGFAAPTPTAAKRLRNAYVQEKI